MLRTLQEMSNGNTFAESASEGLKRDAYDRKNDGEDNVPKSPSGNWVIGKLRDLDPLAVQRWCYDNVKFITKTARAEGLVKRGEMIAADITDVEFYGVHNREMMRSSKPKNGTGRFFSHMALHSVGKDYNIPLDARVIMKDDNVVTSLCKSLKNLDRQGLSPGTVIVDRELFSEEGISGLQRDGRSYLMPAVKNARIKEAIREVHDGMRETASRFSIKSSKTGEVASFNLLIVKKDVYDENAPVTDQYIAFATNLPIRTREELIDILPDDYRKRWIVETGFRVIKDVLARTCSRALHVRMILFYFALLLYSLWRLCQYYDLRYGNKAGGKSFTIASFVSCMTVTARRIIKWEKQQGNSL